MKQVFIVSPFGKKNGIDFSRVEAELIQPALERLGFSGGTTGLILRQGNIRTDMFQKLVVADLVIADISIHNANAFYELGARHVLRAQRTVLIRCSKESLPAEAQLDEVPFDIKTDRYFEYDLRDLAGSVHKLVDVLEETLRSKAADSPIFQLLPKLKEHDHEVFLEVPLDFREEVGLARADGRAGDLCLLAAEVESFDWAITGLRLIGHTLFDMKQHELSLAVWERVLEHHNDADDLEANLRLGTIHQRLGDLTRSDQALDRALNSPQIEPAVRAEVHAQRGRNSKERWLAAWAAADDAVRRTEALRSPFLHDSLSHYSRGFLEDQNHFYSGLNALALSVIVTELAGALPEIWQERFDDEAAAGAEFARLRLQRQRLVGAVECSLQAEEHRLKRESKSNPWLSVSMADLHCLTSQKPGRVAAAYRDALASLPSFNLHSVRKQLLLYVSLDLLKANAAAALALPGWGTQLAPAAKTSAPSATAPAHVILFTGHRIDAPGRKEPRFPAAKESIARELIQQALATRLRQIEGSVPRGLSGGASGGDILFLETCAELGLPTDLYLALRPDTFCESSVAEAGPGWEQRFYQLVAKHPGHAQLSDSKKLPAWLRPKQDYGLWRRNNLWMLHNAIAIAGNRITLIALWDGADGDGPGGTRDMVDQVKKLDAKTIIIDTKRAFGL